MYYPRVINEVCELVAESEDDRNKSSLFSTPAEAERGFYEAFANLDLDRMMDVWSAADDVVCTHPGAQPLLGPAAVAESWKSIFSGAKRGVNMNIRVARRWQTDTLACHVVIETLGDTKSATEQAARVTATNIYRLENNNWHMILHHGGPLPSAAPVKVAGNVVKGRITGSKPTVH